MDPLRWLRRKLLPQYYKELDLISKINQSLLERVKDLEEKNKNCQENINKTNSYWKGVIRTKKGNKL